MSRTENVLAFLAYIIYWALGIGGVAMAGAFVYFVVAAVLIPFGIALPGIH